LRAIIGSNIYMVRGGSFFHGVEYAPLDVDELDRVARDIRQKGLNSVVITSNFAPVRPDIEERARAIVHKQLPDADITLSYQVGGLGLVDREKRGDHQRRAGAIVAPGGDLVDGGIRECPDQVADLHQPERRDADHHRTCPTLPIFTCSAGPTNSIRGAAFLTGLQEAVVADIGGTTTDIGFLLRGFPRETATANYIGGVRTNFRMPDVLSIALGGGTIVRETGKGITLGPDSVGYQLKDKGLVFGGDVLTTTDIAVRAGQALLGDPAKVAGIPDELVNGVLNALHRRSRTPSTR